MSAAKTRVKPAEHAVRVHLQRAVRPGSLPKLADFRLWVTAGRVHSGWSELGVRVVGREESAALNERYRGMPKPTNVLSFPFEPPVGVKNGFLGDLVICAPLVVEEAAMQHKELRAHWAHLVVHGVLHLQGYDHESETKAVIMERLESGIISELGYPDPY